MDTEQLGDLADTPFRDGPLAVTPARDRSGRDFQVPSPSAPVRLAMTQLSLSARAFHRVLKLARTIAGMAGSESICSPHVAEAIQHRQRLRG